jgi:hypothetical protein
VINGFIKHLEVIQIYNSLSKQQKSDFRNTRRRDILSFASCYFVPYYVIVTVDTVSFYSVRVLVSVGITDIQHCSLENIFFR